MNALRSVAVGTFGVFFVTPEFNAPASEEVEIGPEEIVVTARRREETLTEVPSSITALTQSQLSEIGATQLSDITAITPNLTIYAGSAQSNAASVFIRGIGQRDSLQTFEQAVGLYLDGVYLSRMQGSMMRLADIERVEVLRGPQGALYGKNTIGGALNIITRDPFDGGGWAELQYGSFNETVGSVYLAGPVSGDTVAASFALRYGHRDGFYQDEFRDVEYQDDNVITGRLKLAFNPNEVFSLTLAADIMDFDIGQHLGYAESPLSVLDVVFGPVPARDAPEGFDGKTLASSIAPENGQSNTHWGLSATAELAVSDTLSLKSITAYRQMNPVQWLDADGSEIDLADVWATWVHEQISQEFQLKTNGDNWDAVVGAFYMHENSVAVQETFLDGYLLAAGAPIGFTRPGNDEQNVGSYALFGHANYEITNRFTLSVGARWSRDNKDFFRVSETKTSGVITDTFVFQNEDHWSAFTPSVTLDYKLSDQSHLYVLASRGFRSGGFNGRLFSDADSQSFSPEFVWSYETGLKGTAADGAVRYAISGFYNDYKNYQARVAVAVDSTDPTAGFNFPTINAAKLEIYGAELELEARVDQLSLWGSVGLLSASYKEFLDDQKDRTDQEPLRTPDVTLGFGASYKINLGPNGSLILASNLQYVSSYFTSVDNADLLFEDGYALVGAHAIWQSEAETWFLRSGVRNLFDAIYQVDAFEFRTLGNVQTGLYGNPRTWYFTIGRSF
jgi:iron complex outermembrane receptor protein